MGPGDPVTIGLRRTNREGEGAPPEDFTEHDIVVAEFLGDSDLLAASPEENGRVQWLVALPLDPREDWYRLEGSLAHVLRRFLETGGEKYWSAGQP
ncbi:MULTISPECIES: hypothetical protein [unclassified Actinotalea]|uniref:hypothetical protein n=1 Tax=unclassified Actinotalea TaxID=2638618 RepID=UPI0015F6B5F8|nr:MULTISPECIES: hypothetical protein [unclassified Actinotalea]